MEEGAEADTAEARRGARTGPARAARGAGCGVRGAGCGVRGVQGAGVRGRGGAGVRMKRFNLAYQEAYELFNSDKPKRRDRRKRNEESNQEMPINSKVVDEIVVWL